MEVTGTIDKETIKSFNQEMSDDEYAKHFSVYKQHCKGCMNEKSGLCTEQSVIECYLRTLLPNGVWHKACT